MYTPHTIGGVQTRQGKCLSGTFLSLDSKETLTSLIDTGHISSIGLNAVIVHGEELQAGLKAVIVLQTVDGAVIVQRKDR